MAANFPLSTGPYDYVARTPIKKGVHGWDVVALQKALLSLGYRLPRWGPDGYFGDETDSTLRTYQTQSSLDVDGKAGPLTQRHIAVRIAILFGIKAVFYLSAGCIEKESGYLLGNYTKDYGDGTRDFGLPQDNLPDTLESRLAGFDPAQIVAYHAQYVKGYRDQFFGRCGAPTNRRAWELGVLAWHRPAWAITLSQCGTIHTTQRDQADAYIAQCTKYVGAW